MVKKHPYTHVFRGNVEHRKVWAPCPEYLKAALTKATGPVDDALLLRCLVTVCYMMEIDCLVRRSERDGGFQVSASRHDDLIGGRHGKLVRDLLIKADVITRIGGYLKSKHCYHYLLSLDCWDSASLNLIPFPCRPCLLRHDDGLCGNRATDDMPGRYPQELLLYVKKCLQTLEFEPCFDIERHIDQHDYSGRKSRAKGERGKKLSLVDVNRAKATRYASFTKFKEWPHHLSVSDTTGRLFHPVTTMPKDLRRMLRIEGEPLVEIDIANCQPLLLALLVRDGRFGSDIAADERAGLLDVTSGGEFYEQMRRLLGDNKSARDSVKRAVCRDLLFGRNHCHHTEIFEAFMGAYPGIARAIRKFHQNALESLACKLQREEANLMYGAVLPALLKKIPGVPAIPIHDAILVQAKEAERVAKMMKEVIKESKQADVTIKVSRHMS